MRNLALFIVLIAAFFLLLTDRGGKSGSGKIKGKGEPTTEATTESADETQEALSDEYKPQDLSKYSNIQKLNEDFDYRRSKLEFQLNEEVKEFVKEHDRYGKDQPEYEKLTKRHAALRKEFYDNRMKTLETFQKAKLDEPINPNLR